MKRLFNIVVITLLTLLTASCLHQQNGFVIQGEIDYGEKPQPNKGEVYLISLSKYEFFKDTVQIRNGRFVFRGSVKTPGIALIRLGDQNSSLKIYLENGKYKITLNPGNLPASFVEGSESHNLYAVVESRIKGGASAEEISYLRDSLATAHPLSSFALDLLVEESKSMSETAPVERRLLQFIADERYTDNRNIDIVRQMIESKKHLDPGNPAPKMTLKNIKGEVVNLDSIYKNNTLTMLYFWAGANPDSRTMNLKIKEIYSLFRPKGLEIVGITLDDIKGEWLDAIKKDRLPWIQLSEFNGTFSSFIPFYEITHLPQNLFVDNKGLIVKRRVPLETLPQFLSKYCITKL